MDNLWDIVTSNSTLPVSPTNNLWDHLNNQDGSGGGTVIFNGEVIGATNILDILPKSNLLAAASSPSTQLQLVQSKYVLEITGESSGIEI